MSSINSLSGSSGLSSIYGRRTVISGLASGLDTEALIEKAVSGHKLKISNLQQKRTKVEWQQDAYRSIIGKMSAFSEKYTSYRSATNLMSPSFFNSAVKVSTAGKFADLVSATGKTSSNVQILGVKQLAQAATYAVTGLGGAGSSEAPAISGDRVDLGKDTSVSKISGSMTINYGEGASVSIDLGQDVYESVDDLAAAINSKLGEQEMTVGDNTYKANERIEATVVDGKIKFSDKSGAGNKVYISSTTGDLNKNGKLEDSTGNTESKPDTLDLTGVELSEKSVLGDYLSGKTLNVTLDGVTKSIDLPKYEAGMTGKQYLKELQTQLDKSFGAGKIDLSDSTSSGSAFRLNMKVKTGSTLAVSGDAAKAMGLGNNSTTYVDTGKTLGQLLGDKALNGVGGKVAAVGNVTEKDGVFIDKEGKQVAADKDGKYYRVDDKGDFLYKLEINGKEVGNFSKNTTLSTVMSAINSKSDVNVSYSKTTNQFQFTAKESGENSRVEMGGGLAQALFGGGKETAKGQDAIFSMTVNGVEMKDITRSDNNFDVDGMKITLKDKFNYGDDGALVDKPEGVTFKATADADKIVDTIKTMVEDYNAMVTEIKKAYSTLPAQKSTGAYYEPLTDEEREGLSESAAESYEAKAKEGILFGDSDLASLYSRLRDAVSMVGEDGAALKAAGITLSYSNGLTTLSLDESKLRATLESDPDKVRDIFTKSSDGGGTSGLMEAIKNPLDQYGKTTGGKGILVDKAGSPLAPSTMYSNVIQRQLDSIDREISRWQEKMVDQVDAYTKKFSALEQLISEMNAQSSYFSQLSGGY